MGVTSRGQAPDYRPTVLLGAASVFISYTDRVNISIAVPAMVEEFGWDNSKSGVVLGAFFWGYILTQVCSRIGKGPRESMLCTWLRCYCIFLR